MSLIKTISADFMAAYKEKNMPKKDFLGMLKTEVTRESKEPKDDKVIKVIKSMLKKDNEAVEKANELGQEVTSRLSDEEKTILNSYLPKQLSEADLTIIVTNEIDANGYDSQKDMGKLMGFLKANYDGQYNGKVASDLVKSLLS